MPLVVGQLTLNGTDAQNAILAPMAQTIETTLLLPDGKTSRIQPANVYVRARAAMPWAIKPGVSDKYPKGVRARGFWNGKDQLLADDLFPTPDLCRKTFAHETCHQLDSQWMLNSNRKTIQPLFDPDAAGWPAEPFAVYGSAAIFGFTNPPYTTFYPGHVVPTTEWAELKAAALRDDRPVPPGPDPYLRIAQLEKLLENIATDNTQLAADNLTVAKKAKDGV
jgi:hypothetical protein